MYCTAQLYSVKGATHPQAGKPLTLYNFGGLDHMREEDKTEKEKILSLRCVLSKILLYQLKNTRTKVNYENLAVLAYIQAAVF